MFGLISQRWPLLPYSPPLPFLIFQGFLFACSIFCLGVVCVRFFGLPYSALLQRWLKVCVCTNMVLLGTSCFFALFSKISLKFWPGLMVVTFSHRHYEREFDASGSFCPAWVLFIFLVVNLRYASGNLGLFQVTCVMWSRVCCCL